MKPLKLIIPARIWKVPPKVSVAITLFPFILVKEGWEQDPALAAHELHHWYEIRRGGVIPWYLAYILLLPFYGGGRNHPMEKSAYAIQDRINEEQEV